MNKSGINRRQFLETSRTTVAGGVVATVAASLPNATWAESLGVLDSAGADVMLRMCRVLYPHDDLADDYYAACVESLDKKAQGDAALGQLLSEGASNLNALALGRFLEMSEAEQVALLRNIEGSPFFQTVRGHMVVALYNDRKVWSHFGYEGPSFPFGGYLERGFDDIDWLPEG